MSDELIERRTLRGRIGHDREPPVPGVTQEQTPAEAPPKIVVDEPPQEDESPPVAAVETGAGAARPPDTDEKPPIALEPPPEAGDVVHKQMDMPTRFTLRPITGEMYSPDLPWEVIEAPPFEVLSPQPPDVPQPEPEPMSLPPIPEPEPEPVPPPPVPEPEPEQMPPPLVSKPEAGPERMPPPPEDTARLDSLMLLPAIRLDEDEVEDEVEVAVEAVVEGEDEEEAPPTPEAEEPETLIAQKTPPKMPGVFPPAAGREEPSAEQAVPPDERVPLPGLTPTGLAPVPDEPPGDEAVDVDWVVAVGERMGRDAPPELVREEAPPPDLTDEVSPPPRKKSGQLSNLVMVLVLSGLLISVVVLRFVFGVGVTPDTGEAATGEAAALPPAPTATPVPTAIPTPLPPYAQGRIAFAADRDGDFEIYVLDMVTGALMQLTDNQASDRSPAWSPDGSRIVYVSDAAGDDNLYVMEVSLDPNAGGSNAVKLTTDPAADHFPAWSPDGKTIIFSRETPDGSLLLAFDTECLDAGEGACEETLWAIIDEAHNLHGRWSPDGKRIAFTASSFPGKPSVIALINPAGDGYSARVGTGSTDFYPAWSPDGERIAFVSSHMGDFDLWLMTVDDGSVVQFTRSEGDDVEPAWSPDGQFIVFASDREGTGGFDLYLLPVDCESPDEDCEEMIIRLTSDDTDELNPAWTGTR